MFLSAYVTYVILIPVNQSHTCGHKILLNVSYILKVDKAHNTTITFTVNKSCTNLPPLY